jgi:hypothetical protein
MSDTDSCEVIVCYCTSYDVIMVVTGDGLQLSKVV